MPTDLPLLERDATLARLDQALAAARAGTGGCVVITGEAGMGKTRVLDAWRDGTAGAVQWLRSACDALHTPRPLGPLVDLADVFPPALARTVHAATTYNGLFPDLMGWLGRTQPTPVLVIDDLHWADEATLDAVRYVGRRIAQTPALLVLALRDGEADMPAPVRQTLAQIERAGAIRMALAPLSVAAVSELARGRHLDGAAVHRLTSGNPLFVAQVLETPVGRVPASVRNAVLDRLDTLTPKARGVAEWVSTSPGGLEWALLQALEPAAAEGVDTLHRVGLLDVVPPLVGFRHELVRLAVHESMPPGRRMALHGALADGLSGAPARAGVLARRVHHAAQAGRVADVVALAPMAADEALRVSAHAAAESLFDLALSHAAAAGVPDHTCAAWHESRARLRSRRRDLEASAADWRDAQALYRGMGDRVGQARTLANLALLSSPREEAITLAREALDGLPDSPVGPEHALARYALALALANRGQPGPAVAHAQTAVAMGETAGHVGVLTQALSVCAAVKLSLSADDEAFNMLERSISLAVEHQLSDHAAAAWVNLVGLRLMHAQYPRLFEALAQALPYGQAHDLDLATMQLRIRQLLALVETGRWTEADNTLAALRRDFEDLPRTCETADLVAVRLNGLRGKVDDEAAWAARVKKARAGGTELLPADAMGYAAEAAWLRGDAVQAAYWAREALGQASAPWLVGRLRRTLRAAGQTLPPQDDLPAPFRSSESGQWREAHDAWLALGCPYEAALELLDGDAQALQQALDSLCQLGAEAAAAMARQRLRGLGVRRGVRGPRRAPAGAAFGLTGREQTVGQLLAQGLSNAAIAQRLHRSERTVEHQVSSILAKLGVRQRARAIVILMSTPEPPETPEGFG